jgi:hypothetical protein
VTDASPSNAYSNPRAVIDTTNGNDPRNSLQRLFYKGILFFLIVHDARNHGLS